MDYSNNIMYFHVLAIETYVCARPFDLCAHYQLIYFFMIIGSKELSFLQDDGVALVTENVFKYYFWTATERLNYGRLENIYLILSIRCRVGEMALPYILFKFFIIQHFMMVLVLFKKLIIQKQYYFWDCWRKQTF